MGHNYARDIVKRRNRRIRKEVTRLSRDLPPPPKRQRSRRPKAV